MFSVGVVACGKIAQVRHLPEYAENPDVRIAGLYDLNAERAASLAKQYGAKAYESAEALFADPAIDAVSVCSSNDTHAALALAALRAGKHVLLEKPMAMNADDCEELVRTAEACGKLLMIDQNQRLAGAHAAAKKLIAEGAIGRPLTFATGFRHGGPETWSVDPGAGTWFFEKKKAVMGAMADLGIHKTDLIQYLLGQTIVEVSARLCTLDKRYADGSLIGVDDNAVCIYVTDGGAVGTMTASWTDYGAEDNATVIFGTEGVLRIYSDPEHTLILEKPGGVRTFIEADRIQTNDAQTRSGVIDLFVECMKDPTKEGIPASSVLTAMRAVFAAVESDATGRTVTVNR